MGESTSQMNMTELRIFAVALFSIMLGATGQFFFRVGMLRYGKVSASGIWGQLFQIIFTPYILAGFACFGLSSILWLAVISRWQLSYAYPMVALGYVLAILLGRFFLNESLTVPKILGSILILGGIAILGWFGQA